MTVKNNKASGCPIHYAMGMFGDKWSLVIIRDMLFAGKRQYNEFLTSPEGISTNILANRLVSLEHNGIIHKRRQGDGARKFHYVLTEKGLDLIPLLLEIVNWSGTYDAGCSLSQDILERIRKEPEAARRETRARYLTSLETGEPVPPPVNKAGRPLTG